MTDSITTTNTTTIDDLPELHLDRLMQHIEWAAADEHTRATKFAGWGWWNQELYAWVEYGNKGPIDADTQAALLDEARNGICQSAYCQAGSAAVQAGYRLILNAGRAVDGPNGDREGVLAEHCIRQIQTGINDLGRPIYRDDPTADIEFIGTVAQRYFGLDSDEAADYFDADNKLHNLREMVNGACLRRGLTIPYPNDAIYDFDTQESFTR